MDDILTRLEIFSKVNGAFPKAIEDAIEEILRLRWDLAEAERYIPSRIDIIGQNGNDGDHYEEL